SILPVPPGHVPPVSAVVSEVTWTVNVLAASVVPAGTVTPARPPHFRVPAVIEHAPAQPAPMLSIDHARPAFECSGSLSLTQYASPEPVLYTVIVNPIGSPAFTCAASAVFRILIDGAATQVDAVDWSLLSFEVDTVPVLSILPLPPG